MHQLAAPSSQDCDVGVDDRNNDQHLSEFDLSYQPKHRGVTGNYCNLRDKPNISCQLDLIDLCTQLEGHYYECTDIDDFFHHVAKKLPSHTSLNHPLNGYDIKRRVTEVCHERRQALLTKQIPPYHGDRESLDRAIDGWLEIEGRRSMQQAVSDLTSSYLLAFGPEESALEFLLSPACCDRICKNLEYIKGKTSETGKANSAISMCLIRRIEALEPKNGITAFKQSESPVRQCRENLAQLTADKADIMAVRPSISSHSPNTIYGQGRSPPRTDVPRTSSIGTQTLFDSLKPSNQSHDSPSNTKNLCPGEANGAGPSTEREGLDQSSESRPLAPLSPIRQNPTRQDRIGADPKRYRGPAVKHQQFLLFKNKRTKKAASKVNRHLTQLSPNDEPTKRARHNGAAREPSSSGTRAPYPASAPVAKGFTPTMPTTLPHIQLTERRGDSLCRSPNYPTGTAQSSSHVQDRASNDCVVKLAKTDHRSESRAPVTPEEQTSVETEGRSRSPAVQPLTPRLERKRQLNGPEDMYVIGQSVPPKRKQIKQIKRKELPPETSPVSESRHVNSNRRPGSIVKQRRQTYNLRDVEERLTNLEKLIGLQENAMNV